MRVLVTGGSGFIGTNLVDALVERGYDILSIDFRAPMHPLIGARWRHVSVADRKATLRVVTEFQPHAIFHLAARTDLEGNSLPEYAVNIEGTRNILEAARATKSVERLIHFSSRLVFAIGHEPEGDFDYKPSTAYGESKIESERIIVAAKDLAFPAVIVRPTSIWGPWFGVPYRVMFDLVRARRYFHVRGRQVRKSFGYVGNAVHQCLRLLEIDLAPIDRKALWLSDYEPIEVSEWANQIADAFGVKRPRTLPLWPLKIVAALGDFAVQRGLKRFPLTRFRLDNLYTPMVYDTTSTQEALGRLPFTAHDGIQATVHWLVTNSKGPSRA